MNNCPKCGNPLQIGTTSCPICGTNIIENAPVQPAAPKKEAVSVASVGAPSPKPVQGTPVVQPVVKEEVVKQNIAEQKVESTQPTAPQVAQPKVAEPTVAPQPSQQAEIKVEPAQEAPVQVTPTPQPIVEEVKAEAQAPVVQPITPTPQNVEPAVTQPQATSEVKQEVQPQVADAPTPSIDAASLAPNVPKIESATPIPSVPAPSITSTAPANNITVEAPKVDNKKAKKPMNKNVLVIGSIVLFALVVGGIFMMTNKSKLNNQPTTPNNNSLVATKISSNGYKFDLLDGWLIHEDSSNVIITNSNETVVIKLEHLDSGINKINKEIIEGYFKTRTEFATPDVQETKVNSKDAYFVNTNMNETPVQVYFISGTTELTLGATIIYQSSDIKTKFESEVVKLIETLSYSDDSIKAISSMQMYSNIFNIYGGISNFDPNTQITQPVVDDQTQVDNTLDNQTPEQNIQPETTPETIN